MSDVEDLKSNHVSGIFPVVNLPIADDDTTDPSKQKSDDDENEPRSGRKTDRKDRKPFRPTIPRNSHSMKEARRDSILLPRDYTLGIYDVGCGRGQRYCNHQGNVRFRDIVNEHVDAYLLTRTKVAKTALIVSILHQIRYGMDASCKEKGRFVKQQDDGSWVELGDAASRDKVSNALRSAVSVKRGEEDPCHTDHSTQSSLEPREQSFSTTSGTVPNFIDKTDSQRKFGLSDTSSLDEDASEQDPSSESADKTQEAGVLLLNSFIHLQNQKKRENSHCLINNETELDPTHGEAHKVDHAQKQGASFKKARTQPSSIIQPPILSPKNAIKKLPPPLSHGKSYSKRISKSNAATKRKSMTTPEPTCLGKTAKVPKTQNECLSSPIPIVSPSRNSTMLLPLHSPVSSTTTTISPQVVVTPRSDHDNDDSLDESPQTLVDRSLQQLHPSPLSTNKSSTHESAADAVLSLILLKAGYFLSPKSSKEDFL